MGLQGVGSCEGDGGREKNGIANVNIDRAQGWSLSGSMRISRVSRKYRGVASSGAAAARSAKLADNAERDSPESETTPIAATAFCERHSSRKLINLSSISVCIHTR